ncbi:lachrymatory-factor synthase-like protein [Cinnamomum micranthum f. kanehirae]|uniref:Lachrymatory-factor synthase-like protein n=1 Tax=Cinnamomum micranthum f. kanehirae TaxID=337451 RepID=A0A3S3QB74_9MAGN|nr:lachrymatory-factor synthase-like protein [Cinnamomum micranthum f. kanehirae]
MEKEEWQQQRKWVGKLTAKLTGPKPDQVWPFFQDYSNFHKWHPTLDVYQQVEGLHGHLGCVRYCAGTSLSSSNGGEETLSWAMKKLVAIDPIGRTLTYEVIDNNTGLGAYVATFTVLSEPEDGCTIERSFAMAKKMAEDALGQTQSQ